MKAAEKRNFITKLEQLTRQLHWWKARDLSLIGKTLIIKSLGISKFMYVATVLHVPQTIIKKVNEKLYEFLWNSKTHKVKRNVVIQNYDDGGLHMTDLDLCIKAVRVKWIKKYLKCDTDAIWKKSFEYLCKVRNLPLYCLSNYKINELPKTPPVYYKESKNY